MAIFKVAVQPLTWGSTSFDQVCREAASAGYEGIECPIRGYLDNLTALRDMLEENKLECASSYSGVSLLDESKREQEISNEITLAKGLRFLHCGQMVLSAPGRNVTGEDVPSSRSHPASLIKEYAEQINELCRRVKEETGVICVFHNHIGTIIERPEEIDLFMEYTDPELLFAGFDTAQLSAGGADAVEYCSRYASRIKYIHLKDRKLDHPTYGNFCELGLGFIHFPTIIKILEKADYNGWLTVEVDQSLTTPLDTAIISRRYLHEQCGV